MKEDRLSSDLKIISEIGINYNGDFKKIEELIRQSAIGGANFAKFQLYNSKIVFGDDSRKKNELTFNEVKTIKEICDYFSIEFFASVFDEEKISWCEDLGVSYYKIASRTLVNDHKLCEKIIKLNKSTFISLGFWDESILPFDEDHVKYLNCISKYPVSSKDFVKFNYKENIVGLSDHSYGIAFSLFNISNGAKIIEKHFTLNKGLSGNDHIGSMDLQELRTLRELGDQLIRINGRCK